MKLRLTVAALAAPVLFPIAAHALTANSAGAARSLSLRAGVSTGSVVSPGEPMSFEFQSNADATVIVFDIDTHGQVRLLYPSDDPEIMPANTTGRVPDDDSELLVEGERGVEFVFAVAVADPSAIDRTALANLAASDGPGQEPYRIEGDPFLAANTVAGDLIQDVSRNDATFAYTYFYVSERVDHPCYLCGPCDEAGESDCSGSQVVQSFDRRLPLSYPLRRGYEIMEPASGATPEGDQPSPVVTPNDDDDVVVNFYPYGSQVRYVDPNVTAIYGDAWWYDPYYWYYPGWYPYYPGFSVSIGFGWGWGWGWGCWGGYYASGCYGPYYGGCYYPSYYSCYSGYPTYPVAYPAKYKSAYKSGYSGSYSSLAKNRSYAAQRDGDMRIASADVRRSVKRSSASTYAAHTRVVSHSSTQTRSGYYGRSGSKSSAGYATRYTSRPTYAPRSTQGSHSGYTSRPTRASRSTYTSRPAYTPRDVTRAQMSRGRSGAIHSGSKAGSYGSRMRASGRGSGSGAMHSRSGASRSRGSYSGPARPNSMPSHSMSAPRGGAAPSFRGGWGGGHSAPHGRGR